MATDNHPVEQAGDDRPYALNGIRVIEIADERAEYVGMTLASLGADVIKVEPPKGCSTRAIGPFLDDEPHPDRSLHFWAYNRGKRSVVLDLTSDHGRAELLRLIQDADVLIDGLTRSVALDLELPPGDLIGRFGQLIHARMTDFGDDGPWADFRASDLVHLALGGPMSNSGYDPEPDGFYDLAPVAPQLWQAYHIAGEHLVMGVLAALAYRQRSGAGQYVSCAIHEAVAKNTELDVMNWIMRRVPLNRQTARHAAEKVGLVPTISQTKDGRWYNTSLLGAPDQRKLAKFLERFGVAHDIDTGAAESTVREIPGSGGDQIQAARCADGIQRLAHKYSFDRFPWDQAQAAGLITTPVRKPHENLTDEHWAARETFAVIEHPDIGRSFPYPTGKWVSSETRWTNDRPAPLVGEHTSEILAESPPTRPVSSVQENWKPDRLSARGKPLPLDGVRIVDFTWFLASAGATRFLSAFGADSIKIEWKAHPDTRIGAMAPVGGRAARERATGPVPGVTDSDMGGQFNNKNSGKLGLSLNVRDPRGLDIVKRLVRMSDIVAEGFSPGVLDKWGLGYDVLRELKPDIIYAQQSGMGSAGTYGRFRAVGPAAAAMAGMTELSGLPEPSMPAGWGYSYLDWIGAYSFASAMLAAIIHRDRTGRGQFIDASQCETGIFLTAVPILDYAVNGRAWQRIGNRSPYKPAAPHGAYRCAGDDRWIAIACFTETDWLALIQLIDQDWTADAKFATLAARLAHQDELDVRMQLWTSAQIDYPLMMRLQAAGIAAGVCQTAADRVECDPQLAHLQWLTELTGTKIGRWPVPEVPLKMSESPPYIGGYRDRGAPNYGEDNEYVLGELLGFSTPQIAALAEDGVI